MLRCWELVPLALGWVASSAALLTHLSVQISGPWLDLSPTSSVLRELEENATLFGLHTVECRQ